MASRARQPQLRRRLPAGVLVALIVAALTGALASEASGYEPARGDQFFLLSDASVGADGRAIERPKQVTLAGSSSEWDWARSSRGNVLVPIGKRAPGLYLVEAIIGACRATTLVFVSDTVALTKVSAGELLVWTVDRRTGRAVGGVDVAWTDGLGTLQSATTGADGVAVFRHASP